ncbi:hypothetical protein GCM10007108_06310 [Thermogymnomonas acidicola]|uniref:DUF1641 domain-containing protein n=1 Tax=Thermogymnomonas acidicola TaxID=399579 RepID=A0AA37BQK8_9ARCH|nr:hypothetical protein [Thermogymnomonas acidicola]GGM70996.1 hypothetical protein GCM10007108_06310 [Thermogymnomonas acidicola]
MAKEIEVIERRQVPENLEASMAKIIEVLGNGEVMEKFARLLDAVQRSEILTFLTALLENWDRVMKVITEELTDERMARFIRNALSVFAIVSSVDTDRLMKAVSKMAGDGSAPARSGDLAHNLSSLINLLSDPEVSAGLTKVLRLIGSI